MLQSQYHLIRTSRSTHSSCPHSPSGRRSSPGSAAVARCCFISPTPRIDGVYSRFCHRNIWVSAVGFPPIPSHGVFFSFLNQSKENLEEVCVWECQALCFCSACSATFLPHRQSSSRGSCRMELMLDPLFHCCIPFVGITEEVCGGVGDMKMEEEFLGGCLRGGGGRHHKLGSVMFGVTDLLSAVMTVWLSCHEWSMRLWACHEWQKSQTSSPSTNV